MSAVATLLKEARWIIREEEHWCQGDFARNDQGLATTSNDPGACQWCALGAVLKARKTLGLSLEVGDEAEDLLDEIAGAHYREPDGDEAGIIWVNDEMGHKTTLQVFDLAIEKAEKEGR